MSTEHEAIVVGGGIVGASTAYHLSRDGVDTLLVDRLDEGRATDAGAGIIAAATSSRTDNDDWFAFATDATGYYPELVESLERDGVGETSYARLGELSVALDEDELEPHRAALERIDDRSDALEGIEPISAADATSRFPALAEPKEAFYDPTAARVDGRAFAEALLDAAREHGLTERTGDVTKIRTEGGAVSGVRTADGERIDAATVVVAGGAWSSSFGNQLNVEIPVEPKRGQIAHLELPDTETADWPIVKGYRHHYIVPWPDGRIVAGATREAGVGFEPRATAAGVKEVLEELLRVAPGLADATVSEIRVGLRPVTPDGLPVLGDVPDVDGAYLATGHGPTGLMLGPYSGRIVAELATTGTDRIPDKLRADRFD